MSSSLSGGGVGAQPGFLSKERIIAKPGFNRWLVPPAALAIHLCIGMAYGVLVAAVQGNRHHRTSGVRARPEFFQPGVLIVL